MDREHQLQVRIIALEDELGALTLQVEDLRERLRNLERTVAAAEAR